MTHIDKTEGQSPFMKTIEGMRSGKADAWGKATLVGLVAALIIGLVGFVITFTVVIPVSNNLVTAKVVGGSMAAVLGVELLGTAGAGLVYGVLKGRDYLENQKKTVGPQQNWKAENAGL